MGNPWEEISLSDYEKHMSLDSVQQLQTMNALMCGQFADYPVHTAMVLGIAGGNGLEHVDREKYRTVYGVDINADYLRAAAERYPRLAGCLQCRCVDLCIAPEQLPRAELLIANLLIEYIGYAAFQKAVEQVSPAYVSCVIQKNTDTVAWVSDSPYLHVFDRLDEVHHQMEETALAAAMAAIGYREILRRTEPLPNGKALVRLDFSKVTEKRENRMIRRETARLTVRVANREEMEQFIAAQTEAVLRAAYGEMLAACHAHPDAWAWYAMWMIEDKAGHHVGELCFKGLSDEGAAEIGYGIAAAYEGRGYATEAVAAAVDWALAQSGVTQLEAETEEENLASRRVLEKCGFVPTGVRGEEGPRFVLRRSAGYCRGGENAAE